MTISYSYFCRGLFVTALYLVGQLIVGTDLVIAVLFSFAIWFGLLAIAAGGGLASAFGCLNAILIAKFLLIGVLLKILMGTPADSNLSSPLATALVMALGFAGLLVGTFAQSKLPLPSAGGIRSFNARMCLSLAIVLFVVSYAGYFLSLVPDTQGNGLQTGSWVGIARSIGFFKSFAIVPIMLYVWKQGSERLLTHPVVLLALAWGVAVGILSTGKEEAMEPLVLYVGIGLVRYGWRFRWLWALAAAGVAYYALVVFPYSQYVRYAGGREGTFEQRFEVTKNIFLNITTNQDFRSAAFRRATSGRSYLGSSALNPFSRLAMVGEADKLIAATDAGQSFTGWETISWGFKMLLPSFLVPDKPIWGTGNYLAHISGEVGSTDYTTQVSYGVMANLYNAFSLPGVMVGTALFFFGFYYWLRIFFPNAHLTNIARGTAMLNDSDAQSVLCFMLLVGAFQHSLIESSVAGLIASLTMPVIICSLVTAATWLYPFLPRTGFQRNS